MRKAILAFAVMATLISCGSKSGKRPVKGDILPSYDELAGDTIPAPEPHIYRARVISSGNTVYYIKVDDYEGLYSPGDLVKVAKFNSIPSYVSDGSDWAEYYHINPEASGDTSYSETYKDTTYFVDIRTVRLMNIIK